MRLPYQQAFDFSKKRPLYSGKQEVPIDTYFPAESANKLALLESYNKHLYRPNTYLHKWWARRSGTTFRYILKQLVTRPELRDFYKGGGLEGKVIFDPMMGGGNTPHEAIRLGANVIGTDIDPIPVLQAKASLIRSPLRDKIDIFKSFQKILQNTLSTFFTTKCPECRDRSEIQFVLYGLRKTCSCREAIFIDSHLLRKSTNQDILVCPDCHSVYDSDNHNCITKSDIPLLNKKEKRCEICNTSFSELLSKPFPLRYVPLVIVGACLEHGTFYKSVTHDDILLLEQARAEADNLDFGDPDLFKIPYGPKSKDLLRRKITSYKELYTARQLIYLNTSLKFLAGLNYDNRLWLALLISTSLEFNSLLCGYKGGDIRRPGAIRHVFSHHAYSFPYTALENNPVFSGNSSGTLNRLFNDRIAKAAKWAVNPTETKISAKGNSKVHIRGELDAGDPAKDWDDLKEDERKFLIFQCDAATLNIPEGIVDYIVTDPPYYDSVQYSDLSNFAASGFTVGSHNIL